MTYQGTSSSSSLTNHGSCKYDVFLSFRGEDTRNNFTGHLYHALRQRGINTFIDDGGLELGEEISQSLLKAIEESRISIIVFSQTFASSTWCLDELVKILECMQVMGQLVRPVFYGITPSDVRHQKAGYDKAMEKHKQKFKHDLEKVQKWRLALHEASCLSGWHFKNGYEYEFIQRIIDEISSKLNHNLLHVADYPVGLESRILELQTLLDIGSDDCVEMVGICGLGGIGKSTIARAVYNLVAGHFEHTCFLADVRENSIKQGLAHLQETLLSDLVGEENIKIPHVYKGIPIIKNRLSKKKVLLVLDGVDKLKQLQMLAGGTDWFSFGSRIIITTRDKHLLVAHQVEKIFEVGKLNQDEALELFSWNAFRKRIPAAEYVDVSNRVIHYANGLPLALKIIGSDLFGKRIDEWENVLEKYKRTPKREIFSVLKVSYDSLEDDEKAVFLDIACFFRGEGLGYVEKVLDACGFNPNSAIGVLVDKSLMSIEVGRLWMHDLVQDMGREIVRKESPMRPGMRTRLWFHEDVLQVLQDNTGTDQIEGIMLESPQLEEVDWSDIVFSKMKNLRILIVRNAYFSCGPKHLPNSIILLDWKQYPSPSLPSNFHPRKLAVLNLPCSILKLQEPFKKFENLTYMNLSGCQSLATVPDVSGIPNLRELNLDYCNNLLDVHDSVGFLNKLVKLSSVECTRLRNFPHSMKLISLECLNLRGCSALKRFPDVLVKIKKSLQIAIEGTGIEELPVSIVNLTGIKGFLMSKCKSLRHIPCSLGLLHSLTYLDLSSCPQVGKLFKSYLQMLSISSAPYSIGSPRFMLNLSNSDLLDEDLPIIFGCFPYLTYLVLSHNKFKVLPKCIMNLACLHTLDLGDCEQLQDISRIPPNLQKISAQNCTSLTSQSLNILQNQVFCKTQRLDIVMPALRVPEWFDQISIDGHISFWIRNKFPDITVCYILGRNRHGTRVGWGRSPFATLGVLMAETHRERAILPSLGGKDCLPCDQCEVQLLINGYQIFRTSKDFAPALTLGDHLWLFDLRALISSLDLRTLPTYPLYEWNYVQLSCEFSEVKWSGVYLNKKETNMDDILFRKPYPQDSKLTTSDSEPGPVLYEELKLQQNQGWLPSSPNQMDSVNQDQTVLSCQTTCYKNHQLFSMKHVEDMVGFDNNDERITDINCDKDSDSGQQLFDNCENMGGNNFKDLFACTGAEEQSRESPPLCSPTQDEGIWDPMELEYEIICGNDQLGQNDKCQNKDKGRSKMGNQGDKHWNFSLCVLISLVASFVLLVMPQLCDSLKDYFSVHIFKNH